MTEQAECPTLDHNQGPAGYLAWHEWAERMSGTHTQRRCPSCRLWCIWEPRVPAVPA